MKGGVSTVMKILEKSTLWENYKCYWLETQINSKNKLLKILYLIRGFTKGLFIIPRYQIVHFQTTPGTSMIILLPIFIYALLCRKRLLYNYIWEIKLKNMSKIGLSNFGHHIQTLSSS